MTAVQSSGLIVQIAEAIGQNRLGAKLALHLTAAFCTDIGRKKDVKGSRHIHISEEIAFTGH